MQIEPVQDKSPRMKDVLALHRRFRGTLGFLPATAFDERAASGTLLAAIDASGATAGYALYDLPRSEIALRHLCVAESARGKGVARDLIDEIVARHPERRGIRLRCRRDWPANEMWPRLDFEPVGDSPGRSAERHLLTTWWRDFGHPTLFTLATIEEPRLKVALDTDVFIDLEVDRPGCEESRGLLSDWVLERAELVVTKEVGQEVNRSDDDEMRRRHRRRLQSFGRADGKASSWQNSVSTLRNALPAAVSLSDHDEADIRQVARAHAAGVAYFVSRDEDLVAKLGEPARSALDMTVASPGGFLQILWDLGEGGYAPVSIENTRFTTSALLGSEIDVVARTFVNHGSGETLSSLRQRIRRSLSDPEHNDARIVRSTDGELVAAFVQSPRADSLEVSLLRVAGALSSTIARQVVHLQRQRALESGRTLVRVTEGHLSAPLVRALDSESFVPTPSGWCRASLRVRGSMVDIAEHLASIEGPPELGLSEASGVLRSACSPNVVAEIESRFAPLKIYDSELPTYLVPIRAAFAEQLFDTDLSTQTLFARTDSLGLSREHVYYRASRPGGVRAPARIVWYVVQDRQISGTGSVRACSRLVEVAIDRPRTLYRRFGHLGVYRQKDVEAAAGKDKRAMALRFSDTEPLAPISLSELREITRRSGRTPSLRSPWVLPEGVFADLYERGTRDGP